MKLILTGASGFVGRNVLLRAPREWEILALYHQATDLEAFVSRHRLAHVRPVKCNLTDEAEVRAVAARTPRSISPPTATPRRRRRVHGGTSNRMRLR